jgi:hypothetical protein
LTQTVLKVRFGSKAVERTLRTSPKLGIKVRNTAGVTLGQAPRHEPYGTVTIMRDILGNRWNLIQCAPPHPAPAAR